MGAGLENEVVKHLLQFWRLQVKRVVRFLDGRLQEAVTLSVTRQG